MINDSFIEVICMVFAVGAIGIGFYEIFTKKLVGRKDKKIKKGCEAHFTLLEGITYIFIGFAAVGMSMITILKLFQQPQYQTLYWILLGLVIAGIVVDAILAKKYIEDTNPMIRHR